MKIVTARLNHETNTFSTVPTPLASFGPDGPTFGEDAYRQAKGSRTALGAFIEAAERRGADLAVAVNATANPSGRVDAAASTAPALKVTRVSAIRPSPGMACVGAAPA